MVWLLLFVTVTYVFYTLRLVSTSQPCNDDPLSRHRSSQPQHLSLVALSGNDSESDVGLAEGAAATGIALPRREIEERPEKQPTDLQHVVFGIAASAKLWEQRKEYIKIWYKADRMRGVVWLDDEDHTQYYYIGSLSESHLQNIYFSYGMAYGGGGFAISYPLAKALEKIQDRCIQRYPGLYGSDDRMQACMAELGVPLTKEVGFHQYDVYGNLFGLLASHPVTPLVSLHHLDVVEPIFPNVTRVEALQRLAVPMKMDSAGIMQQSICYDKSRSWTVSVSWGFAVQIFRGVFSPREIEMPSRTFLNWYRRADYTAYAFNTRPVARNPCQKPFVFYLSKARSLTSLNTTVSEYQRHRVPHPECKWKMADPSSINMAVVYKRPDPQLWSRSPRRNCCRVMSTKKKGTITIDVGMCRDGEISEV
ncbi:unnamed protein product [Linum tenue]|uniref:Uncharacterized protein n=1 Tax=Linum tenue TaxID=586396 RepID=A0AAV0K8H2_9ROSI|nr:unnamed protein product [Linum tenue]